MICVESESFKTISGKKKRGEENEKIGTKTKKEAQRIAKEKIYQCNECVLGFSCIRQAEDNWADKCEKFKKSKCHQIGWLK